MLRNAVFLSLLTIFLLPLFLMPLQATPVTYQIDWENTNTHYFYVTLRIPRQRKKEIQLRMPAWRPGRYRIENFSAAIINFNAVDDQNRQLDFRKSDKDTWIVQNQDRSSLTIRYQVYANTLDAGSSYLQENEAYINPVNLLMYLPGREDQPCVLRVRQPPGWDIACALTPEDDGTMHADSFHQLVDSPLLISPEMERLSFTEGRTKIDIAIQGQHEFDRQRLIDDFQAIVATQGKIMNGIPIDKFLFLLHFVDFGFGHGVEHANSTSIVAGPVDFGNDRFYHRLLAVASHEFFHIWNVKRIVPASLLPPDYARENYTSLMWFFEGVTSYYDELTLVRCGFLNEEQYLQGLQRSINRHLRNYGRFVTSLSESSWDSWNKSATAPPMTEVSVYTKGKVVGFLLDMEIRRRTGHQKSLDDVIHYLWQQYGIKKKGVPEDGVQKAVEAVSGKSFSRFFGRFVDGTEALPINDALSVAGLKFLRPDSTEYPAAHLGINLDNDNIVNRVYPDSPALDAGLDLGDRLIAINRREANRENLESLVAGFTPGDSATITVIRRKMLREFRVRLGQAPYFEGWIMKDPTGDHGSAVLEHWLWINNE